MKRNSIFISIFCLATIWNISAKAQLPDNVDLVTGRANLNIPIFSYNNKAQRLSLNLLLNYNSGGIKVDQVASDVGTDWKLSAGGSIVRHMLGNLDDKYPEGAMYQTGINTSNYDGFVPIDENPTVNNAYKDNELDVYEFDFNGRHGSFVIGRNKQVLQHVDSKMKIEFVEQDMTTQNIITRISKFIITTEDGLQYTFDQKEQSHTNYQINSAYQDDAHQPSVTHAQPEFPFHSNPRSYYVSAWYLSSIKNLLTQQAIQFEYVNDNVQILTEKSRSQTDIQTGNDAVNNDNLIGTTFFIEPKLNNIIFPDSSKINFIYEDNLRLDYGETPSGHALSSIQITRDNTVIKKINFSYKYFYRNQELTYAEADALPHPIINFVDTSQRNYLRLALKDLQIIGAGLSENPYHFYYKLHTGINGPIDRFDIIPPRFEEYKNAYGYALYYESIQNGLLEKVEYPTGGYTQFYYQSVQVGFSPGIHLGIDRDGNSVIKIVSYDGIDHKNDQITLINYVLHDKSGNILQNGVSPASSKYGVEGSRDNVEKSAYVETSGSPTIENIFMVLGYCVNAPGIIGRTIGNIINNIITFFFGPNYKSINYVIHKWRGVVNNNMLPTRYSEAEVVYGGSSQSMGKVIYKFTSFADVPPLFPTLTSPYSMKQRAPDWCYGLPKEIAVYNKQGQLVDKKEYTYRFIYRVTEASNFESAKVEPNRILCVKKVHFDDYESQIQFDADYYYPISGRAELIKESDKKYELGGTNYTKSGSRNEYDSTNYQLKKKVAWNSIGDSLEQRIYYPQDYTLSGPIQTLKNNNILSFPISTETWVRKGNSTPQILSGVIYDYQQMANGDLAPTSVYQLESDKPLSQNTVGNFNPSVLVRNLTYFKKEILFNYDDGGNVTGVSSRGKTKSQIYDYNDSYLIAEVTGAPYNDIAYTSFEADGKGNWIFNGTVTTDPTALTGKKFFELSHAGSAGITKSGLNSQKEYIVSYWSKNTSPYTVSGTQGAVTVGRKVNGWTYFEHHIKGGNTTKITGGSAIDELRLYPVDARMITHTYNPLIGITTSCGADNTIQYYEYDGLGRINAIRDQDHNIVKTIDYHYKQ